MAELALKALMKSLKRLFTSSKYSDFVITCGPDTYKVHTAIICSQSGFFERAERFPVVRLRRTKSTLPADDPEIIKLLIEFFYVGEYVPPILKDTEDLRSTLREKEPGFRYEFPHTCSDYYSHRMVSNVCPHHDCESASCESGCKKYMCEICTGVRASDNLLHAKMYVISDKHDIPGLKLLACEKFEQSCSYFWDRDEFLQAVDYLLSSTPRMKMVESEISCAK